MDIVKEDVGIIGMNEKNKFIMVKNIIVYSKYKYLILYKYHFSILYQHPPKQNPFYPYFPLNNIDLKLFYNFYFNYFFIFSEILLSKIIYNIKF